MPDLSTMATDFQTFLNQLMPHGAIVAVVDDDFRVVEPTGVIMPLLSLRVLGARTDEAGEVIYDVLVSQWAEPTPETGLIVTVTDPFEEVRPNHHVAHLRDTFGDIAVPGRWLLINTTLDDGHFAQVKELLQ